MGNIVSCSANNKGIANVVIEIKYHFSGISLIAVLLVSLIKLILKNFFNLRSSLFEMFSIIAVLRSACVVVGRHWKHMQKILGRDRDYSKHFELLPSFKVFFPHQELQGVILQENFWMLFLHHLLKNIFMGKKTQEKGRNTLKSGFICQDKKPFWRLSFRNSI